MPKATIHDSQPLDDLFPVGSRVLLTGTGRQFIERIGVDAVRTVIVGVLMGENIRLQTEPLTRQRIAQLSGAIVALFAQGWLNNPNFTNELSTMAVRQLRSRKKLIRQPLSFNYVHRSGSSTGNKQNPRNG